MDAFISPRLSILILSLDQYVKSGGVDIKVIKPLVHQIKLYIIALVGGLVNCDDLMLLATITGIKQHPILSLILPRDCFKKIDFFVLFI